MPSPSGRPCCNGPTPLFLSVHRMRALCLSLLATERGDRCPRSMAKGYKAAKSFFCQDESLALISREREPKEQLPAGTELNLFSLVASVCIKTRLIFSSGRFVSGCATRIACKGLDHRLASMRKTAARIGGGRREEAVKKVPMQVPTGIAERQEQTNVGCFSAAGFFVERSHDGFIP